MRITNQMMINSSISNIQVNKNQMNTLSTELSTQKKISKPSDDPIIAIRALRLRSSLDEVTQYLGKNIPDASSWLSVTHDALDESNSIIKDLYRYCVQGSTDSYSESERNTLAESLNKLVEAYYEQGNVDYAGRYVFTGHATDRPLTYQSDADAKDIMVPRVNVTFANVNNTYEELIDIFRTDRFTRLPVYEDTQDNIVGIINMKDLLLYNQDDPFDIRNFLRKPHFTYEYKDISDLLVEMRESTFNIAIVLDEYGEMTGLITLEDILEEIVGEIHDEYDENEDELIKKISDQEYIVEGSMSLDDVNDHLHTEFTSEDYDSLGGLIIEHLDRLPEDGDEVVTADNVRLVVDKLDKNRIERVHVYLPEPAVEDTDESDESKES